MQLPGLPSLNWLERVGSAEVAGSTLTMVAPPASDWFNDPAGSVRHATAPALMTSFDDDAQLSARVSVGFESAFDAGVLFVHQGNDDYAKLCFERSPAGESMIVTVVTRGVSDDSNEPVIDGDEVFLRISRVGPTIAFHYSLDSERWRLSRLFALRDPTAPTTVGFVAQSPTGAGCNVRFVDVRWTEATLTDPRDGS